MHFIKEPISATHPNSASWSLLLKQPGHLRRGPAAEQQQTSKCPWQQVASQSWGGEACSQAAAVRAAELCPLPSRSLLAGALSEWRADLAAVGAGQGANPGFGIQAPPGFVHHLPGKDGGVIPVAHPADGVHPAVE